MVNCVKDNLLIISAAKRTQIWKLYASIDSVIFIDTVLVYEFHVQGDYRIAVKSSTMWVTIEAIYIMLGF